MSTNEITYRKMNGLGNEIVVVDLRKAESRLDAHAARQIASHPQSFFDQMMVLLPPRDADTRAYIEIWNNDGSRAEACGNGMRCVTAYESEVSGLRSMLFETDAGSLDAEIHADGTVSVNMGRPSFNWQSIPLSHDAGDSSAIDFHFSEGAVALSRPAVANVGNPHAVFFVDRLADFDLPQIGPKLEHASIFPERANITLAEMAGTDHIRIKVWERGAGITRACGSAACATAVTAHRRGLVGRNVRISLPGGDLKITWNDNDTVTMTGPWELEHIGSISKAALAAA